MALDFPVPGSQTPVNTWSPTSTPSASTNGLTYLWDGQKWGSAGSTPNVEWNEITGKPDFDALYVETAGDEMTGNLTVPSLNGGPLAGFRNQIINGDFRIWQRGTNGNNTSSSKANYVSADRFATSVNSTLVRDSAAPEGLHYGARSNGNIFQCIELESHKFVVGSKYTVSVWCDRDMSTVTTNMKFRDDLNDGLNSVNASAEVAYTSTGETSGIYTRYAATVEITGTPLVSNILLLVIITNPSPGSNTKFAGVQLEPGPVATPFEHRPIGTELALCQRYYFKSTSSIENVVLWATGSGNNGACVINLPVEMRVSPSCSVGSFGSPYGASSPKGTVTSLRDIASVTKLEVPLRVSWSGGAPFQTAVDNFTADAEL